MFDGLDSDLWSSDDGFAGLAGPVMATVLVLLVVAGIVGAVMWAAGRSTERVKTRGFYMMVCSGLAAVLAGSIAGAVAWSSSGGGIEGGLEALLPEDARPGAIEIEVEDVLVNCVEAVSVEADTAWAGNRPTSDGHEEMLGVLEELGVDEAYEDEIDDGNFTSSVTGAGDISRVLWHPADGDCSTENTTAVPGSTVTVAVYVGGDRMLGGATTADLDLEAPE
ncbi:hypothetical protein [Nesterenkonia sp. K-15-9-6]|uniref:hypothetical protein n=1 Tax=Nesterenkonia sp. K-15-9-6 TaxID=3093918 RepID=UPI004043B34D